ncbi:MAG: replicative DNA helicase [Planctomycetes bacterium]|nr:replicative DNA helicase [Planctomycetota bacterium]
MSTAAEREEELLVKTPPRNLEAEACVLGSIMLDNDAVAVVSEVLKPSDFYDRDHRAIFETVIALYDSDRSVDAVTVKDRLSASGRLDELGGIDKLIEIMESVPSATHAADYAAIVKDRSVKRQLISLTGKIQRSAYGDGRAQEDSTAEALIETIESEVFKLAENKSSSEPTEMARVLQSTVQMIEDFSKKKGKITGCATDFYDLDDKTGGFQGGDLIILAARPSVGKTTFSINCAMNMAVKHNRAVAFFSLEMSKEQIATNMLCALSEVKGTHLRKGTLSESEWAKILDAAGRLHDAKIFIDDTPGLSPTILRGKARRLKRRHAIDAIVIDYLQLMDAPNAENRQQQISTISRSLKALARELEVPIIALSQINRAAEKEERRPRMSDLRESGAIEQDADLVMFLYDPNYQTSDAETVDQGGREVELILAKQRNGPTGMVPLLFCRDIMKFRSRAHSY